MAAFDHFRDLYDVALKPRLLRSLLKEQVPDETCPFRDPSGLSSIVYAVKTHKLLSVSSTIVADEKHVSSWRSSIDAWVDRIMMLCKSNLPDKCWAGVCLLGVTCTQCSSDLFLASYSDWFSALLSQIQQSGVPQFVKIASCAALSDLLTRLGGFLNLKKDGTSHAGKLVQPMLKLLSEDGTEAVLEVAAHLLFTILTCFPSSVQRHHDNVEAAIVSKIMSNCSANTLKKLAFCLATLPKSRGDEESWSLMMQKILLSISALLNDALEGLEEESRRDEAVKLLVPPGKSPPPPLGAQRVAGETLNNGERSQQLLISNISSLMQCCCTMLTSYYPVQVEVPVRPLLTIIRRVLMVHGFLPESLRPFTTAMQQEFVCSQLPFLHLYTLDVLAAVVKGIRSQLLPHAPDIVRLLIEYLKICSLPELRTKVYSIIRVLLLSTGCGMALYISEEVVHNGYIDLKFSDSGSNGASSTQQASVEPTLQPHRKKRKHGTGSLVVEQHASFGSEVEAPNECSVSIGLKVAAIEALDALLVVGGALRSDSWRRKIDDLLIEVATKACRGGFTHGEKPSTWEDFQLVALRALLASLLSPAGVRPPHLAKGFELFRKGKQGTGTTVAEFCGQALSSLEVLIHPRALPLIDMSLSNGNSHYFGGRSSHSNGNRHDVYDFLSDLYMENGTSSQIPAAEVNKNDEKLLDISTDKKLEDPNIVNDSSDKMTPIERDESRIPEDDSDRVMVDVENHEQPSKTSEEREGESDADVSDLMNRVPEGSAPVTTVEGVVPAQVDNNILKLPVTELNDDEFDDFPDIVDADPDTSSDSE